MAPIIQVADLEHVYNPGSPQEVAALRGVHLTVDRGEILAIVGANGSGKSTLVRHFNALLLPTAGSVIVAGFDTEDFQNHRPIRQTVGMVFQNPDNQLVGTTVEEDIAFGPENLGLPPEEIARRIDEALAAVGLSGEGQRAPHHLSGGQKQKVAIAAILAMRPAVMVLDEPTAMLDPQGRQAVMTLLRRLNESEGITIIYTTHFMEEAAMAHRVVLMSQGKVEKIGAPRSFFAHETDVMKAGLEIPPAGRLANMLRQQGFPLPPAIVEEADLVESLCRLSSNN